jgi:hypothetical protein
MPEPKIVDRGRLQRNQKYAEMTPDKARDLANEIGVATSLIIDNLLQEAAHIAIGCRKSYGFLYL